MRLSTHSKLADINEDAWNALVGGNPFLSHGFLSTLESTNCLEPQGWYPHHLVLWDGDVLRAALPLYLRDNSYGEFVFDWAWAEAYEKGGGKYYPKLVTAVPFSPVGGSRFLIDPSDAKAQEMATQLLNAVKSICQDNNFSSWHCLFLDEIQKDLFSDNETLVRLGCQYHWFNDNYLTFDNFLSALSSKKRKNIKRERRKVSESGLEIECLSGDGITKEHWKTFYAFYCSTFYQKWGEPRLTLDFFLSLNSRLPDCAVLILAKDKEKYVAGAFALSSEDTLYGRHWGCNENYDSLHFELCYYQTIEYCIRHKLKTLDAGAQGEHKISRGFVPIKTWSLHWLRELSFRKPVENFLNNETEAIEEYINKLEDHSAFKKDVTL